MKKTIFISGGIIIALAAIYFFWFQDNTEKSDIYVPVKKESFKVTVTTTGELDAENKVNITGPSGMRAAQIWDVQISRIIPEGKVVQQGEFVAELDKSALVDKLRARQTELTKAESQYTQTQLDTTLTLREARDNLINLQFAAEQKKLELEQSAYEPPATIKQAEIAKQKAERDYKQAKESYSIKVDQAKAKMQEAFANLSKERSTVDFMNKLLQEFTIIAPENGMLIYAKDWRGTKKKAGTTISAWNPVVATLPDLSSMISKTYVNEVDIRKIKKGQAVEIGLDAFPDKKLTGKVISVANMGEQKPNSDAKVFEVVISVNESDTTLRPSMTTSNVIVADVISDVLSVPLEAIYSQGDSVTFVYKKDGMDIMKQEVRVGKSNDESIIIEAGLAEGDVVALSVGTDDDSEVRMLSKEQPVAKK
ncbi:MAG: efflux RND transporter periplasmic adaptor subunit [Flammeovirgaceae bacterium]